MAEQYLQLPDETEVKETLETARGLLRLVTLAPELKNVSSAIR